MSWILVALLCWVVLSVVGLVGASAVCRSGHLEDVARGFTDNVPSPAPYPVAGIPSPSVSPEPALRSPSALR